MLSNLIQFFYTSQETNDSSSLLKAIVMFDEQVFLKKYALSKTVFGKELKIRVEIYLEIVGKCPTFDKLSNQQCGFFWFFLYI